MMFSAQVVRYEQVCSYPTQANFVLGEYLFQALYSLQYPVEVAVNSGVNSRHAFSSTEPGTKTDYSDEMRSVEGRALADDVSHEATTTVPHTGVLPSLSTSADLRASQHTASSRVNLPEGEARRIRLI